VPSPLQHHVGFGHNGQNAPKPRAGYANPLRLDEDPPYPCWTHNCGYEGDELLYDSNRWSDEGEALLAVGVALCAAGAPCIEVEAGGRRLTEGYRTG
jgi:hypothetical protein